MKKMRNLSSILGAFIALSVNMAAFAEQTNTLSENRPVTTPSFNSQNQPLRVGIVNTKRCLEESKLGKQEQANLEKMKKQMESVLKDLQRTLEEIESKLDDDDYMDSISDEAASDLKRKKRTLRQEGAELQNQYMHTFQEANLKIIQKMTAAITKASSLVAQDTTTSAQSIDAIFTDEACTYYAPRLDVSDPVIAKMNEIFDAEQKDGASKSR